MGCDWNKGIAIAHLMRERVAEHGTRGLRAHQLAELAASR